MKNLSIGTTMTSRTRMLISVVLMALLLTFLTADSLSTRSLGAAAVACCGSCGVEGNEYGCDGTGDFGIEFMRCNAEDVPSSEDEVTAGIKSYAYKVGEYPGDD
jgi:hypothetical protein